MPGYGSKLQAARSSLADCRGDRKKRFGCPICVTTRRRNLWLLINLRRELRLLAARFLCLGVPGFGKVILAMLSLAPGRLPAVDLPLTFRLLAVTLVPAPWLVLTPALFAQALPRTRPARSGLGTAFSLTLVGAHGRNCSQGKSSGRMRQHSLRALSNHKPHGCLPVYRVPANKTEKETNSEICVEGDARMGAHSGVSLEMLKTAAEFLLGPTIDGKTCRGSLDAFVSD